MNMADSIADYAERTRSSRTHGWVHAIDSTGEFSADEVADLSTKKVGDTITLTIEQIDEVYPSTVLDPTVDGRHAIEETDITGIAKGEEMGVLLYVEIVDGTFTEDGADYLISATHHPRDIYGCPGTPLRDAIDILEDPDFDPNDIVEARADLVRDKGLEYGSWSEQIHRGNDYWASTYRGAVDAARNALTAAQRNTWFPGSCCHGDEYIALAARDLIDTVPAWTRDAYELIARPYTQATGRKLHPEDPNWVSTPPSTAVPTTTAAQ